MTININSPKRTQKATSTCNSLDTTGHKVLKIEKGNKNTHRATTGSDYKQRRLDIIKFQNRNAVTKSMRLCNRVPIRHNGIIKDVLLMKTEGKEAKFANLQTCNSFWCPECSEKSKIDVRNKARMGIRNAIDNGYSLKFLTLTIPREFGNSNYEEKFKVINDSFKKLNARLRTKCSRKGVKLYSLKGLDVTIDTSRYDCIHLHLHSLVIMDKEEEVFDEKGFEDWVWRIYRNIMKKKGVKVSRKGFSVETVTEDKELSDYIVKTLGSMERELTSTKKNGKSPNSKGWFYWVSEIAREASDRDIAIYKQFLIASKGKRTYDFSRNWNELIDLNPKEEEEEEEIKEEGSFYCWSINKELWEAIKSLNFELKVLSIIDNFIDNNKDKLRFKKLVSLFTSEDNTIFGEQKIQIYKNTLKRLVLQ